MNELTPGVAAPPFKLEDQEGKIWSLEELRGNKIVLFFYPADHTPGCTKEACEFRDSRLDFENAGYIVLGVSSQGQDSHRSFADEYSLNFPLLVDEDFEAARAYGVVDPIPSGDRASIKRLRSTFVIDEEGIIARADYAVSSKTHVGELKDRLGLTASA